MAFSSNRVKSDIQGTTKVEYYTWNAASVTTGTITTGLKNILHISHNNLTSEDVGKWTYDSNGVVTVTGVTSNDIGTLKVEGF
jgi:hypothetical protein